MSASGRREFLRQLSSAAVCACACSRRVEAFERAPRRNRAVIVPRRAAFQKPLPGGAVQCLLCPCAPEKKGRLLDGETCVCHVRTNRGGVLYVTNYGRAGALHVDPIEKNPLYHFCPGARALAVSAPGCSLACQGCQNWELSQARTEDVETVYAPPEKVVQMALEARCQAVAFTYTEPMTYYEYMYDIARLARQRGLTNTVATGGYVCEAPLRELARLIDAFSVSVKAFNDQDYLAYANGTLTAIQKSMETIRSTGRWLEVVVLVIPTISDDLGKMRGFVRWVKRALGPETPVHFDRYWPSYKLTNLPQTPQKSLEDARALALAEGIRYAYVGNLPGHWAANTICPRCQKVVVRRVAFTVTENNVVGGACRFCRHAIGGEWKA